MENDKYKINNFINESFVSSILELSLKVLLYFSLINMIILIKSETLSLGIISCSILLNKLNNIIYSSSNLFNLAIIIEVII